MDTDTPSRLYRSEAFAEDVFEFVAREADPSVASPPPWLVNLLPVGVALVGVAFALVPAT